MTLSLDISKRFDGFELEVALGLPMGLTVLFGPSGSGKSTLLGMVAGLVAPDRGKISMDGKTLFDSAAKINVPPHRREIGYVFQDARLFPHMSVLQNLRYGRRFAREKAPLSEIDHVVALLGLEHVLGRRPSKLSGGEAQRVALGRALLARPKMLLADEPLAALDGARKAELLPYFERLRDEISLPILYVTHSVSEAARLASHVVALDGGRVKRQGTAAEVLADPELVPGGVRGVGALLGARVLAHTEDGLSELDASGTRLILPRVAQPEGSDVRVRIAAQDVILATEMPSAISALNILEGRVLRIRTGDGPGAIVTLAAAGGEVHARITQRSLAALGLQEGLPCFAIVKTVSIAREDVG